MYGFVKNCGRAMSPKGNIIIKKPKAHDQNGPKESPHNARRRSSRKKQNKPDASAIANTDIKNSASSSRPFNEGEKKGI